MSVENELSESDLSAYETIVDHDADLAIINTALDTKVEDGANDGAGSTLFKSVIAKIMHFKTLIAGTNISFGVGADTITINATGGGGSADITETEIDFGVNSIIDQTFVIIDANISTSSQIIVQKLLKSPSDSRSIDEIYAETLDFNPDVQSGSMNLRVKSLNGRVSGKFLVGYLVG